MTKALRKDVDQRYQTMRDVALDLNALRDDQRVKRDRSAAVAGKDAGRGTVTRRWTWIMPAVAAAMILAVAGVWYFTPRVQP